METTPLIFLNYAREDVKEVTQLYQRLSDAGFKPWMDKDILPGELWRTSIRNAIERADFFIVILSAHSVSKSGFLQSEIKAALRVWQKRLKSDIYLIPVALDGCKMPKALSRFQRVDLYAADGWTWLVKAIHEGWERRAATITVKDSDRSTSEPKPEQPATKRPWVVLSSLTVWAVLVWFVIWPWIHRVDTFDLKLSILAHLSAAIWWAVLLWAFHHLAFQIGALFSEPPPLPAINVEHPPVALLYTTCDDFMPECCQSCLGQDYRNLRVLICDDSQQPHYQQLVREFYAENTSRSSLITRANQKGFKAGNLNHAIQNHVQEDWILLVDADQLLPTNYVSQFVSRLPQTDQIAFVQAAHQTMIDGERSSYFQTVFSPGVKLYYARDLGLREHFGLVPLLGHGAMIRRSAWEKLGGFPEVVSEDFAFTLRASSNKYSGKYLQQILSYEGIPYDFGGFVVRLKKFAKGTAELLRFEVIPFLKSSASIIEKWDLFMMLFWFALMPLVTINGFLGAYVCHRLWKEGLPYLQPMLPYLYTWMLLSIFAVSLSVARTWSAALRFHFWATAIYSAALPVAGITFLKHLFVRPSFDRTPKNEEKNLDRGESIFICILGLLAIVCSVLWLSPFTPILMGQGIGYFSYPLYGKLSYKSFLGTLSRLVVYLPGFFMLFALLAMWKWGRY